MTIAEKNRLLLWNSILWVAAMTLPSFLYFTLGSTKFPWPILVPFFLFGFLQYSNNVLSKLIGEPTDGAEQVSLFFSRNKSRMLYHMLSAEAFVGPCAQRTQQVWRPNLGRQTCCEGPGQARTFAMACEHAGVNYSHADATSIA